MSEFLSRLGGAALNDMKGTPLDRILNHLMGGEAGASGLQALVDRLRGAGLGDRVDSWIGSGENRPVQPQELEGVLGGKEADAVAHEAGMERPGLLAVLSQILPKLVDGMTPEGRLPQPGEAIRPAGVTGSLGEILQSALGHPAGVPSEGQATRQAGRSGGEPGQPGFGERQPDAPPAAAGPSGPDR